jgi:hypothetical protein
MAGTKSVTTDNTDDTDKQNPSLIRGICDIRGSNDDHLAID